MDKKFNIRVYGLLIRSNQVLVCHENRLGMNMLKFPGGGLEYGEGTADCVIREFKEELDLKVEVISHFYTTDFFVESAFSPNNQVISIYYIVKALEEIKAPISTTRHNHKIKQGAQSFRWIPIYDIQEDDLTLIIDKKVAEMLNKSYSR